MITGLHWPESAETADAKVYPGLLELLLLVKNIDVRETTAPGP